MEMKRDKGKALGLLLCCMVAAFFLTSATRLVYGGGIFGLLQENYMKPMTPIHIFLWLGLTAVCFACLYGLGWVYRRWGGCLLRDGQATQPRLRDVPFWLAVSAGLLVAWTPYLLTYCPGGIFADSITSLYQVLNGMFSNRHPLLFTMGVGLFVHLGMRLGGTLAIGVMTYTLVQTGAMALVMGYFVLWLRKKGARPGYYLLAAAVIAVVPLFPFYAIAMWKDTPFSLALLLYTLYVVDILQSDGKKLFDLAGVMKYLILTFFVCFYRNNGIYIALLVHLTLTVLYGKHILREMKLFQVLSVVAIAGYFILYGPVYHALDLATDPVESLGITNQQIFAVFADEKGVYSQEEADFISNIWDLEEIPEKYTPMIADTPKWYMDFFDEDYLDDHLSEYFEVWLSLCFKNFGTYVDAWLMETMSFWSPVHGGAEAYVQAGVWSNGYDLYQRDLMTEWFGWSIAGIAEPTYYVAPGLLFWLAMLFAAAAVVAAPRGKGFFAYGDGTAHHGIVGDVDDCNAHCGEPAVCLYFGADFAHAPHVTLAD